ncbi:hypothetical protein KAU11_08455 [Candidatus Babeliales bacterium]|nr:hypothetical protein [Candidatus Babeliales bacterium]
MDLNLIVKSKDIRNLAFIQNIFSSYQFVLEKDDILIIKEKSIAYKNKDDLKMFIDEYFIHKLKNYMDIISYEIKPIKSKLTNFKDCSIYDKLDLKKFLNLLNLEDYNKTLFNHLIKKILSFNIVENRFILDGVKYKTLIVFNKFFVKKNNKLISFKKIITTDLGIDKLIFNK